MNILVPSFAHEWDSEYEKLFMAFMYRIGEDYGWEHRYTIYPQDVRYITQRYFILPQEVYGKGWKSYLFGKVNSANWVFQWKRKPIVKDYEVTDERAILIWGYLEGRAAEEKLVPEEYKGYHEGRVDSVLTTRKLRQFKYYKQHDKKDQD